MKTGRYLIIAAFATIAVGANAQSLGSTERGFERSISLRGPNQEDLQTLQGFVISLTGAWNSDFNALQGAVTWFNDVTGGKGSWRLTGGLRKTNPDVGNDVDSYFANWSMDLDVENVKVRKSVNVFYANVKDAYSLIAPSIDLSMNHTFGTGDNALPIVFTLTPGWNFYDPETGSNDDDGALEFNVATKLKDFGMLEYNYAVPNKFGEYDWFFRLNRKINEKFGARVSYDRSKTFRFDVTFKP